MKQDHNFKKQSLAFTDYLKTWTDKKPFGAQFSSPVEYLLNNPGKCIRPTLVLMVADELKVNLSHHYSLALAIELHHTYTLVHDDLPSMDNDDLRRGKPTLHKVIGEANALLVGDLLLAKSFEVISQIDSSQIAFLNKLFAMSTGSKGLILGQKLDLEFNLKLNKPEELERIFELKTARLFQFSLTASYLLATEKKNQNQARAFWRLGTACGILFQLIDDFQDLQTDKKSDLNIFRVNPKLAMQLTEKYEKLFLKYKIELKDTIPQTIAWLESILINIIKNSSTF